MNLINPADERPPYVQLADIIAARIANGQYPPESQLPTRAALSAEFDLGNMTVHRAIEVLRERGLIITATGRGTYVKPSAAGRTASPLDQIDRDISRIGLLAAQVVTELGNLSNRVTQMRRNQP